MVEYSESVRRWAAETRFAGTLADADATGEVGLGADEAGKRLAVRFALRVREGRIETLRYQVFGCGFSLAACAATAHLALGRTLDEAAELRSAAIETLLDGLPPERGYCVELAREGLQAAIAAARQGKAVSEKRIPQVDDHGPRIDSRNPIYRWLMDSAPPAGILEQDRHLFACLLAVAAQETPQPDKVLGFSSDDLKGIIQTYFPHAQAQRPTEETKPTHPPPPPANPAIQQLLLGYLAETDNLRQMHSARCLTQALAARSTQPGHLWIAMGLFERPQLSAAIARHLPALAAANHQGMRWKRFFFKTLCDQQGGLLCPSPDCGMCSDSPLCFPNQ